MSRYEFGTGDHSIVVGWDNPLQTYFAQVWEGNAERDEPLLWAGASPEELPTVETLQERLRPFAELPNEIRESLQKDFEARTDLTPHQSEMLNLVKSLDRLGLKPCERQEETSLPDQSVGRATRVLANYQDKDPTNNLTVLLTDLMHWSKMGGLDFEHVLWRARKSYEAEIQRDHGNPRDVVNEPGQDWGTVAHWLQEINDVVSRRFVDSDGPAGCPVVPLADGPSHSGPVGCTLVRHEETIAKEIRNAVPFSSLSFRDKADVLYTFVGWDRFREQGLKRKDEEVIWDNVLADKPRDQWLEGTTLIQAYSEIHHEDPSQPRQHER